MRLRGTKFEKIIELPPNGKTLREFAKAYNLGSGPYVQVKYQRFLDGKGSYPGYVIKCWNGINIAIKDE